MVSDMCKDANFPRKTNHSLRAIGATALFQSNIPEKIIKKKKTKKEQYKAVSKVMMTNKTEDCDNKDKTEDCDNKDEVAYSKG